MMFKLDVAAKRGTVLNGVLFRQTENRTADTVMIAITGIHGNFYSALWANIMIVGAAMIYTFGLAHHILGCAAEWIYIKSDHTEEGRRLTNDFFGKTSATMVGCYAGIVLFSVAHFIPVVAGLTPLPAWACVFNLLPLFLVQAPFNITGAGNIAGAAMYLGLFILFLI